MCPTQCLIHGSHSINTWSLNVQNYFTASWSQAPLVIDSALQSSILASRLSRGQWRGPLGSTMELTAQPVFWVEHKPMLCLCSRNSRLDPIYFDFFHTFQNFSLLEMQFFWLDYFEHAQNWPGLSLMKNDTWSPPHWQPFHCQKISEN